MSPDYLLKLLYISKRMKIGMYDSVFNTGRMDVEALDVKEFMREEGKHTMMTVKVLDEQGVDTPKRKGEIAERLGENLGKAAAAFGWRGTCFFMQFGEEMERLMLKAASNTCDNEEVRDIIDLIVFEEKKHSRWWRSKMFERRRG